MKLAGLGLLATLAACAPVPKSGQVSRRAPAEFSLPPMKTPAGNPAPASTRSNTSIARDFMLLAFQLENGRKLPVLTRFEGPITLRVIGTKISATTERDLGHLIARLRAEARIPLTRVDPSRPANITVNFLTGDALRRVAPQAACFVAPGVSSWQEFTGGRSPDVTDWTALATRNRMAVFLPGDASAQEIRDCLHEEIAQALGPVNDLYYLTDSIFNDDNFQTILTGFDMLVLRAFYDTDLRSGMTPQMVARRLPAILARIHPEGHGAGSAGPAPQTPPSWRREIEAALGARRAAQARLHAAKRAVGIARDLGWNDNRLAFSLYAQGRVALARNNELALASFIEAGAIFGADPRTRLHGAHVAVQMAAFALSAGRPLAAIEIVDHNSAIALRAENASLLSTLLMIKAAALDALGNSAQAGSVRLDSLGWARYGQANTQIIRDRLNEIAALSPPIEGISEQ